MTLGSKRRLRALCGIVLALFAFATFAHAATHTPADSPACGVCVSGGDAIAAPPPAPPRQDTQRVGNTRVELGHDARLALAHRSRAPPLA